MPERNPPRRLLLTIPEAAVALGIGRTLAYELVLKGRLPSIKLGRARRSPVASLEQFVAQHVAEPAADSRAKQPMADLAAAMMFRSK